MPLTEEDKNAILDLCGTKGNIEKGILFLHMMCECTDDEARAAVEAVRAEYLAAHP